MTTAEMSDPLPDGVGSSEHCRASRHPVWLGTSELPPAARPSTGVRWSIPLEHAISEYPAVWIGPSRPGDQPLLKVSDGLAVEAWDGGDMAWEGAIPGFAHRCLWPALHGCVDSIEQRRGWWDSYLRYCTGFARRIAGLARRDGVVWLHGYVQMGVGHSLRTLRPDLRIGLTIDTPFDRDGLEVLGRRQIGALLVAYDVVALQRHEDVANATEMVIEAPLRRSWDLRRRRNGGHGGIAENGGVGGNDGDPRPEIISIPVGVAVERWLAYRDDPGVCAGAERLGAPRGVLGVGVDRADFTAGITEKLRAIEVLLDNGVINSNDFRYTQVVVRDGPSTSVREFLDRVVSDIVARINARHPRDDRCAVVEMRSRPKGASEVATLLRAADVVMATAPRSAMTLTALRASVLNGDRPVDMVVSHDSAAAERIGPWCRLVDGSSPSSIALGLEEALRDRRNRGWRVARARSAARQEAASQPTAQAWADAVIRRIVVSRLAAPVEGAARFPHPPVRRASRRAVKRAPTTR